MTFPMSQSARTDTAERASWLAKLLQVQNGVDRRINAALDAAAADAERELGKIASYTGIGAAARREQLVAARYAIAKVMRDLFGNVGELTDTGMRDAAAQAAIAHAKSDGKFLDEIFDTPKDRQEYIQATKRAARRNVMSALRRMTGDTRSYSKRVYKASQLASGQVERVVTSAIARGASPAELAVEIRKSILPHTPGGVSYAAKRFARTEINNAFHATSIEESKDRPWVESMGWRLSKSHPKESGCLCERYARTGTFAVEDVPKKPHPNCFCYIVPIPIPFNEFKMNLLMGNYDDWAGDKSAA